MGRVISPNLQTRAYGARERPPVSPDYRVPPHLQTPGSVTEWVKTSISSCGTQHNWYRSPKCWQYSLTIPYQRSRGTLTCSDQLYKMQHSNVKYTEQCKKAQRISLRRQKVRNNINTDITHTVNHALYTLRCLQPWWTGHITFLCKQYKRAHTGCEHYMS